MSVSDGFRMILRMSNKKIRTITTHGVGCLVDYLARALDGEAGPFLHGSAVEVLLGMLFFMVSNWCNWS